MRYRPRKILLADDSKGVLTLMTRLLDRMGYSVVQAENGAESLEILRNGEKPDLMIMDVYMPEMDGIEALEHIMNDKSTSSIPVVMLSVDTSSNVIRKCRTLGCSDYLGKPIDINSLHDVLQKTLFSGYGRTRKHVRADYNSTVRVEFDGTSEEMFATTLSEGGIYLQKDEPLPIGTDIVMHIELEPDNTITVDGRIIYNTHAKAGASDIPPGMAVEFKGITEAETLILADHIKILLTG